MSAPKVYAPFDCVCTLLSSHEHANIKHTIRIRSAAALRAGLCLCANWQSLLVDLWLVAVSILLLLGL